jgi:hypothetical protein
MADLNSSDLDVSNSEENIQPSFNSILDTFQYRTISLSTAFDMIRIAQEQLLIAQGLEVYKWAKANNYIAEEKIGESD